MTMVGNVLPASGGSRSPTRAPLSRDLKTRLERGAVGGEVTTVAGGVRCSSSRKTAANSASALLRTQSRRSINKGM
ncbi:hypothetical protein D3C85_1578650 [compost metagenome]